MAVNGFRGQPKRAAILVRAKPNPDTLECHLLRRSTTPPPTMADQHDVAVETPDQSGHEIDVIRQRHTVRPLTA